MRGSCEGLAKVLPRVVPTGARRHDAAALGTDPPPGDAAGAHRWAAVLAQQAKVTRARKLRVDATVVEPPIHSPTASGLLGDGVQVLTRLVLRAKPGLQEHRAGKPTGFRHRRRSLRRTLQALYRVVRRKAHTAVAQQRPLYERLLQSAEQTLQQAQTIRQALD